MSKILKMSVSLIVVTSLLIVDTQAMASPIATSSTPAAAGDLLCRTEAFAHPALAFTRLPRQLFRPGHITISFGLFLLAAALPSPWQKHALFAGAGVLLMAWVRRLQHPDSNTQAPPNMRRFRIENAIEIFFEVSLFALAIYCGDFLVYFVARFGRNAWGALARKWKYNISKEFEGYRARRLRNPRAERRYRTLKGTWVKQDLATANAGYYKVTLKNGAVIDVLVDSHIGLSAAEQEFLTRLRPGTIYLTTTNDALLAPTNSISVIQLRTPEQNDRIAYRLAGTKMRHHLLTGVFLDQLQRTLQDVGSSEPPPYGDPAFLFKIFNTVRDRVREILFTGVDDPYYLNDAAYIRELRNVAHIVEKYSSPDVDFPRSTQLLRFKMATDEVAATLNLLKKQSQAPIAIKLLPEQAMVMTVTPLIELARLAPNGLSPSLRSTENRKIQRARELFSTIINPRMLALQRKVEDFARIVLEEEWNTLKKTNISRAGKTTSLKISPMVSLLLSVLNQIHAIGLSATDAPAAVERIRIILEFFENNENRAALLHRIKLSWSIWPAEVQEILLGLKNERVMNLLHQYFDGIPPTSHFTDEAA